MQSFSPFAESIRIQKYSHGGTESWEKMAHRVATNVLATTPVSNSITKEIEQLIAERKFIPGGRYLYAAGRPLHQVNNCLLLRAQDSREGWADLLHKSTMSLMTGAGIGVDYSLVRPSGSAIKKTGGFATGPVALMQMVNEAGRFIMQGGSRRSAIWAGLLWSHPDCEKFITIKNWRKEILELKAKDYNTAAALDGTNISVQLNTEFFRAYWDQKHERHALAQKIYWMTVRQMLKTAEPGFSVDFGKNEGENLRNACTELTSEDDSDICNLGSINMARISSLQEMTRVMELSTVFLLAGTVYSDIPYSKVEEIRNKNRRLGLGLMGLHEWLLLHNKRYGPDDELQKYLEIYQQSTGAARQWASQWGISRPVKTRAVAPNGTIGIVAETSTGIEPIFCVALKRRYLDGMKLQYQYVIDPTAQRLVDLGVPVNLIEDAYGLAKDVTRRLNFQAWIQSYVDHGISSTINLPAWDSEWNNEARLQNFGDILIRYLPRLRGVTCYPDGARSGQPLTPVPYEQAAANVGKVFLEQKDICELHGGGSCGN